MPYVLENFRTRWRLYIDSDIYIKIKNRSSVGAVNKRQSLHSLLITIIYIMVKSLKKSFAGVMIAAFVFAGFATPAKAQTVAELQAMINTLMAQISAMQGGNTNTCTGSYVHTVTLKQGSTGSQVMAMQSALGIAADGKFGPMTKSKVMSFQTSKGLTADGVVGPSTGAAIASSCTTGGSNPSTPSTPGSSTGLNGGTGDITVDLSSEFSGEDVGEGEEDVEVLAFDIEADDESDVMINSIKVELSQNTGADSEKLDDYADEVSVWFDGKKVGSSDADEFNENNDIYTRTISLSGVKIEGGEEERLTVAVTALNNLDSGDIDTDQFNIGVSSIRFTDGDGVVTTESFTLDVADATADDELEKLFDFEDFAGATDVELKASLEDDSINEGRVLDVDDTEDTKHEILSFTLEARGDSDIWVDEIPVVITTTGETDEAVIVLEAALWMDGDKIASETVPTGGAVTFDDLDMTIDAGEEVEFIVQVELQDITGALDNGDTVQATLTVASIDAEDEAEDSVTGGDLTGTAVGDAHAAYDEGIMVDFMSATAVRTFEADAATEDDQGTYKVKFKVTAFDGDMYIDRSSEVANANAAGQGVEFSVTSTAGTPVLSSNLLEASSVETEDNANVFYVEDGETREFTLTVIYAADSTPTDGSHSVKIESINWGTATDNTNANYYEFNLNDFKTDALFLNGIA